MSGSTSLHPSTPERLAGRAAGVAAGAVLAGLLVGVVGVGSARLFGASGSELTVVLALVVALSGVVVAGVWSARTTWRVVEIVVAAVLAVAGGVLLWAIGLVWGGLTAPLASYPPASALLSGLFLVPGVLGGLVVRKPGAAVFTELVAGVLEALFGSTWGFSNVYYGLIEGLGAEVVLAVLLYRRFGPVAAALTGVGTALAGATLDLVIYYPTFPADQKLAYVVFAALSGAVIAGLGSWLVTRALAAAGALAPLASGRDTALV